MSDRTTVSYLYDGTFDGLLTAVFEAYANGDADGELVTTQSQLEFDREYREVATDREKADRVARGIRAKMGTDVYNTLWIAFLSGLPDIGTILYRYLRLGFEQGRRVRRMLTDPRVIAVNKIESLVSREAAHLLQFVRFAQTVTGVYYAEITPQYAVLPIIMPHFVHRLNTQAFVIYDKTHQCSALFDGRRWALTTADGLEAPDLSENERAYRKLWKTFYDTVAIEERINPALRRQLMPKKYWKNMVEMNTLPEDDAAADKAAETTTFPPSDAMPSLPANAPFYLPDDDENTPTLPLADPGSFAGGYAAPRLPDDVLSFLCARFRV